MGWNSFYGHFPHPMNVISVLLGQATNVGNTDGGVCYEYRGE